MRVKTGMKVSTSTSTLPAKRQEDEPLLWVWIPMADAGLSQRSLSQCSKTGSSVSTERRGAPSFQPGRKQPPFSGLRKRSQDGKPGFPAGEVQAERRDGSSLPAGRHLLLTTRGDLCRTSPEGCGSPGNRAHGGQEAELQTWHWHPLIPLNLSVSFLLCEGSGWESTTWKFSG